MNKDEEDKTENLSKFTQEENETVNDDLEDRFSEESKILIVDPENGQDTEDLTIPFKTCRKAYQKSKKGDTIVLKKGDYDSITLIPGRTIIGNKIEVKRIVLEPEEWNQNDLGTIVGLVVKTKNHPALTVFKGSVRCRSCSFEVESDSKEISVIQGSSVFITKSQIKLKLIGKDQIGHLFNLNQISTVSNCSLKLQSEESNNHLNLSKNDHRMIFDRNKIVFQFEANKGNRLSLGNNNEMKYNFINFVSSEPELNLSSWTGIEQARKENLIYSFLAENKDLVVAIDDYKMKLNQNKILVQDGGKSIVLTLPESKDPNQEVLIYCFGLGKNCHLVQGLDFEAKLENGNLYLIKMTNKGWKIVE